MKFAALLLIFIALPLSSYGADWFEGENLLVEPPDSELYDTYVKNESGWKSTMWQSKSEGSSDTYVVNIVSGRPSKFGTFRKSQDQPGRASCDDFTSEEISDSKINGYKAIFWSTSCSIQGVKIHSIQLAIAGRDNLYHVRKLWKIAVAQEELVEWQGKMSGISLCDTRQEDKPCPDGYTKVDDN